MSDNQLSEKLKFLLKNARRFSLLVLLLFLALGAVSALSLVHLRTEYSMRQFLPPHHPLIEADDKNKARFQLPEFEPFFALVTLESGSWFEQERIERLRILTEQFHAQENVQQALSIATVEGASSSTEGITVGRLLALTPPERWQERVGQDPILTPGLLSPDGRTALVAVWIVEGTSTARAAAIQEGSRTALTQGFPGATVRLGGVPAIQAEMNKVLGRELRNFLLLSLFASLCTLLLFFRSLSSVVVPVILLILANLLSLGWMAWAGVAFTVLSSTLPVLVALTVVSMCTHTMLRYSSDWALATRSLHNPNPLRVLLRSYGGLLGPNTLTAITTSIGFLAIGYTRIPLIHQYGITVGISIFVCWFVVIGALLPLLALFPVPQARDWTACRARWAVWVTAHHRAVLLIVGAACVFLLWEGRNLNWSARLFNDLPAGYEARATTELADSKLGGIIPLDLVIESVNENAWNDPALIARLDALAEKFRGNPAVGSVVGPQDFLRAAGQVQGRGLPVSRAEAAEYGFLYSLSPENVLKRFLTVDGRAARLSLRLHDLPADQMKQFVQSSRAQAEASFPGLRVQAAGMATTVHELNNELCAELIFGFWQALAAISVVLLFVFRSLRWAVAAALPNLVPVVLLLGALSILGTPVKPGIALIFSIALGISFDNTVYLLGRLRLLRERSRDGSISVTKAWYQEGNLCLFSSIALAAGFLVFLASFFSLNQQFGFYMVVAIVGGLIGDLVLLPALLCEFPGLVRDEKVARMPAPVANESERRLAA